MAANAGRKPTPAGLKLVEGRGKGTDSGGRPVKAPPAFRRLPPERPAELSEVAGELWEEFVAELQRLQLLAPVHGPALQLACEAYARWSEARAQLAAEGLTYTSQGGLVKLNPLVGVVERASAEFRAWCAEFGLSPAAEHKLSSPETDPGEENPFAGAG
ncbi:phage terminase small subunit P27 family [Actinomadura sp. ATCC 31491]|uniref:Phage terminase small subunit P27 family n=1 Tax=Actinomadura luzonensis TaxID=2805427 RepID=A0ABT0FQ65_9ACTN|nr:phage terminase small subunit P27 family [Actinomadura luzonensis]MCK2214278.1 phage terminase small subunit P27 family [Actinomadura luzonensis]